jgi:hypothetical protein
MGELAERYDLCFRVYAAGRGLRFPAQALTRYRTGPRGFSSPTVGDQFWTDRA